MTILNLAAPINTHTSKRFNRTYRSEVLNLYLFNNLHEVKETTSKWINIYAKERPHDSLNDMTPNEYKNAAYQFYEEAVLRIGYLHSQANTIPVVLNKLKKRTA
ncbi:integrase core domain-containing protein [Paraglaciecola aquimarina]|uniref:Integrase core domain-containing protein n=1 Tax=Paraglaciecola aquimarina TaxID=1235557 RepID=A0ABU3SS43_9ALTE|nr:integrase core domain-containing protein [Paraglaciecola aquimarina]MDU0352809.1 integrase core domain-containing protein [Paraglaciecola aquimarina]